MKKAGFILVVSMTLKGYVTVTPGPDPINHIWRNLRGYFRKNIKLILNICRIGCMVDCLSKFWSEFTHFGKIESFSAL
jgi:hypothetical protein